MRVRPEAVGIYQLEGATFCLECVRFMNVAVHEYRRSTVVSALAAIGTFDGVVNRRCRTWSFQLLPELRYEVLHPMC
jgi:hypothetical protein